MRQCALLLLAGNLQLPRQFLKDSRLREGSAYHVHRCQQLTQQHLVELVINRTLGDCLLTAVQLQRTIESPVHHTRLSEARVHLHIGSKSVLVAQILTQLKSLVQAPHVIEELHHDAQRVVGGSNEGRSSRSRRPSSTFCFFAQTSKSEMYMMPSAKLLRPLISSTTRKARCDSRNSTPLALNTFRGQRWHSPTLTNVATS